MVFEINVDKNIYLNTVRLTGYILEKLKNMLHMSHLGERQFATFQSENNKSINH